MRILRDLLDELDLPAAELSAARLDGEVLPLAGAFAPVDLPSSAAQRARAALGRRSRRLVAEGLTAAWIWGAHPVPPRPARFCLAPGERLAIVPGSGAIVRQLSLEPEDVVALDALGVTTPLRTAVDLARFADDFDAAVAAAVRRLAADSGFGQAECRALMDRGRNLHGKRRARERLAAALGPSPPGQPALTRYTS